MILYYFLTVLMFLDCVVLVMLVLLQLPKKDAGMGVAFGGGATDALFGAGSGNVLTKITKYAAGIFFALAIVMAMVASHNKQNSGSQQLMNALGKQETTPAPAPAPAPASSLNGGLLQAPLLSNVPPSKASASAPATTPVTTPAKTSLPPSTNK